MATPEAHAKKATPSGFHKWSNCTASATYEMQFPNETNIYMEEGTLAHSLCELFGRKFFHSIPEAEYKAKLEEIKAHELWQDEMIETAEFYVDYLKESANKYVSAPHVVFETRVDISDYVPFSFGTCDCIMIGGDTLRITDYKHGKGIPVSSVGNGQMRLYALGALKRYEIIYGDTIKTVCTAIVQPRITEDVTEEYLSVSELKAWGEALKPIAHEAYYGPGKFVPGEWCKFCKGKAECRARAMYIAGFSEYVDKIPVDAIPKDGQNPCLSDDEVSDLLIKGAEICEWYGDLQAYATQKILGGGTIPGWKVVEGRKVRVFKDADRALQKILDAGYEEEKLYTREQKSLAQLEKVVTKKKFAELMQGEIEMSIGKPTLVPESDKRDPYRPVGPNDFSDLSETGGTA